MMTDGEIDHYGDQKGSKLAIIQSLRERGALSRVDLSRLTGLSRATVSLAVAELIQRRIVSETQKSGTVRGRPALLLELAPRTGIVVGAAFGSTKWTIGAFDLMGNTVDHEELSVTDTNPAAVVRVLTTSLPGFFERLPAKPLPFIGLGLPGLVNTEEGKIFSASDLGWHDVPIGEMVWRSTQLPAVVLNRHRARGLAECRYGSAHAYHHVVYIGVSTGIAAGIYDDGKLVTGAFGGAGEIGHLTIEPNGALCPCGNHGCLQLVAAANAIESDLRRLLRAGRTSLLDRGEGFDLRLISAEEICAAADAGDGLSREVVAHAADYLGIAMANLVNTLNPEAVVLGGPIPTNCRYYVQKAAETMRRRAMTPLTSKIEVTTAAFTLLGGALGAATYALDRNLNYSCFR